MEAAAFVRHLAEAGAELHTAGDRLRVRPKTPLTDHERQFLRDHKPEIIAVLQGPARAEATEASLSADAPAKPEPEPAQAPQAEAPVAPLSAADREAIEEAVAERAAIRQYDSGETRQEAERQARAAMRVYHYRLTNKPGVWLTMISPGCDMEMARRAIEDRFGSERVLEVKLREVGT